MKLTLYKQMGGPRNKINKSPSGSKKIIGVIKESPNSKESSFDIKTPTLTVRLSESEIGMYNYAKINNNYYFITNHVIRTNRIHVISFELDVLYTFKDIINKTPIIASYESDYYDPYIVDNRIIPSMEIQTKVYTRNLDAGNIFVLGVNGDVEMNRAVGTEGYLNGVAWYIVSYAELNNIIGNLYDTTWGEALNEKLFNKSTEGLLSLHVFPMSVPTANIGAREEVIIGNLGTGVTALRISGLMKWELPTISIPSIHNNFLDMQPYTTITANIAGVGGVPLDPKQVMGKTLSVSYTGRPHLNDVICEIRTVQDDVLIATAPCTMALSIPLNIESSVGTLLGLGSVAMGLVAPAVGLAMGSVGGAIAGGLMTSAVSGFTPSNNSTGGGGGSFDSWTNHLTITITSPKSYRGGDSYTDILNVSGRGGKINEFTGYIMPQSINPKELDTMYQPEIVSQLTNGFIV